MTEQLHQKLNNGEIVVGTHIFAGMPLLTETMAQCGYDVLWLDMEHTAIGVESLCNNLIAARAGGTPAWVRIAWNDPVLAKPVLDMGADGLIFPYVRTAEEAKLAAAACTYPPNGVRGYGPMRAQNFGAITQKEYITDTYRNCRRVIQIEHVDAVRNLREIAQVEGIDAFIVGLNDLSASVGHLGDFRHPDVFPMYAEIAAVLREFKKPFGVSIAYDEELITYWKELGATIFFAGCDAGYVFEGARNMHTNLSRLVK